MCLSSLDGRNGLTGSRCATKPICTISGAEKMTSHPHMPSACCLRRCFFMQACSSKAYMPIWLHGFFMLYYDQNHNIAYGPLRTATKLEMHKHKVYLSKSLKQFIKQDYRNVLPSVITFELNSSTQTSTATVWPFPLALFDWRFQHHTALTALMSLLFLSCIYYL